MENPRWSYIVEFQRRVGIRRDELRRLKGMDLERDESGYLCVVVRRGKGGKCQYQRILQEDVELIRLYFEAVAKDGYVFDQKYFENDLNFHRLRAEVAKAYYGEQLKRIKADPQYAEQLEKEIRARWEKMNVNKKGNTKRFKEVEIKGVYVLRGKNREFAIKKGLPICPNG